MSPPLFRSRICSGCGCPAPRPVWRLLPSPGQRIATLTAKNGKMRWRPSEAGTRIVGCSGPGSNCLRSKRFAASRSRSATGRTACPLTRCQRWETYSCTTTPTGADSQRLERRAGTSLVPAFRFASCRPPGLNLSCAFTNTAGHHVEVVGIDGRAGSSALMVAAPLVGRIYCDTGIVGVVGSRPHACDSVSRFRQAAAISRMAAASF